MYRGNYHPYALGLFLLSSAFVQHPLITGRPGLFSFRCSPSITPTIPYTAYLGFDRPLVANACGCYVGANPVNIKPLFYAQWTRLE